MKQQSAEKKAQAMDASAKWIVSVIIIALCFPFNIFSVNPRKPVKPVVDPDRRNTLLPDTIPEDEPVTEPSYVLGEEIDAQGNVVKIVPVDSIAIVSPESAATDTAAIFNPDPSRAVWLSALCPGLGQIYNRRYWKLPIVIGGFMGLGYATSWNNNMLRDYTRAYADILDNDPNTNSYMDFFPSTTKEEDLNKTWLTNTFKSRKDYYRRNRDLCIICMAGLYLLAMVDAYVDAALSHFDISPDLSMQVAPALIPESQGRLPGIGLQWALNF